MDIREITPRYSVSPQISPEDCATLVSLGYTCIINNRPDMEIPPSHHTDVMEAAAAAAGLVFVTNPLTHDTMTDDRLAMQRSALDESEGKVLAYCASGTRSTVAWMLSHAQEHCADDLLHAAASAGYQLDPLRPRLEMMFAEKS